MANLLSEMQIEHFKNITENITVYYIMRLLIYPNYFAFVFAMKCIN